MGLFTYTLAGTAFILLGAWESLTTTPPKQSTPKSSSSSVITFFSTSLVSLFFITNSLISLSDALNSNDNIGLVIQLEVISISALFLLYSALGLITHLQDSIFFPPPLLNLISLFAFVEEFLLFYLQRKDPDGIENRYFDLFLLPISICILSTILELKTPNLKFTRLTRGIGLISQGTWIIQMGFSFYSSVTAHGCFLHEKSRGNFTIKCKGHMDYHRGRAIATLQFNCQLALLVASIVGIYAIFCRRSRIGGGFETGYKVIGAEMQPLDTHSNFTLDSDDDDVANVEEKGIAVVTESVANGNGNGYSSH